MIRVHCPDQPLTVRRFAVTTHRAVRTGLGEDSYVSTHRYVPTHRWVLTHRKNIRILDANLSLKQPFLSHR